MTSFSLRTRKVWGSNFQPRRELKLRDCKRLQDWEIAIAKKRGILNFNHSHLCASLWAKKTLANLLFFSNSHIVYMHSSFSNFRGLKLTRLRSMPAEWTWPTFLSLSSTRWREFLILTKQFPTFCEVISRSRTKAFSSKTNWIVTCSRFLCWEARALNVCVRQVTCCQVKKIEAQYRLPLLNTLTCQLSSLWSMCFRLTSFKYISVLAY